MEYKYLVIEGNIGVGKTSLAAMLAERLGSDLILEEFEDNYFLPLFYQDKERYAFHTEISFLLQRYEQLIGLKKGNKVVADYYFMKTLIFAKNNLSDAEFNLFFKLYYNLKETLPKPELIIFLNRSNDNLLNNIHKRGRSYEQSISAEYLTQIYKAYKFYLGVEKESYRIVCLNVNHIDFVGEKEQFEKIYTKLNKDFPIGITEIEM